MTTDPSRSPMDDIDADLSALLASMKDDRAPADLEARLLTGLATAGAGAAVVKVGFFKKALGLFGASGVVKSMLVGTVCGGLVCGAMVVAEGPSTPPATGPAPSATALLAAPPRAATPPARQASSSAPDEPPPADNPPPASSISPSARAADSPSSAALAPALPGAAPSRDTPSALAGSAPTPTLGAEQGTSATAGEPPLPGASDALRRELLLVRPITALVDAGQCDRARAAIAAYRAEHARGQLAGEVSVLEARCQGH
ncbi:MAG: hypothetical protein R3B70_37485 [Polyangiaceae bacterium]